MTELELEFGALMNSIYNRAKAEADYDSTDFLHLLDDKGPVGMASYILAQPQVSTDFVSLKDRKRLDLTMEAQLLANPKFWTLFDLADLETARKWLRGHGYFADLPDLAKYFRGLLVDKRFVLLYAYNGTGKTRLCSAFKSVGQTKNPEGETDSRDTLYFSAFTEDLFAWDNDLTNDHTRLLEFNEASRFFDGVRQLEMEVKIGALLERHATFSFAIDYDRRRIGSDGNEIPAPAITFFRERDAENAPIPIKVSRGEENLFKWCWFLANFQLVLDGAEAYNWVKFVYIDDPVSSLDEQNAVAVATQLATMIRDDANEVNTVISTHHPLFFNVLYNELTRTLKNRVFFLGKLGSGYSLVDTKDTPFFHHVACLLELHQAARSGLIFTHHFNMMRVIVEKTASFLGYAKFEDCILQSQDDEDGVLHKRLLNLLSHGKYSLFDPVEMLDENKQHFRKMLDDFTQRYAFNSALLPAAPSTPAIP